MENTTTTTRQDRESGRKEGRMAFTRIETLTASEGSLAGFATTCTECGMVLTNTMETSLVFDAQAHAEYHTAKAASK